MDLEAQIRALEDQVAREADELERARSARNADAPSVAGPFVSATGEAGNQADGKSAPRFAHDADDRSIFVNGIPKDASITPEMVAEIFQDCGQILKCTLLRNRATNELKGSAYIEFSTYEAAGKAIDAKNNVQVGAHTLTVTKKKSMFNPNRARGSRGRGMDSRGGRGMGVQPDMLAGMMGMMMGALAQMNQGNRGRGRGGFRGRGAPAGAAPDYQQHQQGMLPNPGASGFKPFQ